GGAWLDPEHMRFKVPAGIRRTRGCFSEQILKGSCEPKRRERDVLAEVRSDGRVEGGWIALVQRDDGRDAEWMVFPRIAMWPVFLGNQAARARQQQTATQQH